MPPNPGINLVPDAFNESAATAMDNSMVEETTASEPYDDAPQSRLEISVPTTEELNANYLGAGHLSVQLIPAPLAPYIEPRTWGIMDLEHPQFRGTREDHCSFIATAIYWYYHIPDVGPYLWARFRNDFEDWEQENWELAPNVALKLLASVLRDRGVFVGWKKKGKESLQALSKVIEREEFRLWTEQEIEVHAAREPVFRDRLLNQPRFRKLISTPPTPWNALPLYPDLPDLTSSASAPRTTGSSENDCRETRQEVSEVLTVTADHPQAPRAAQPLTCSGSARYVPQGGTTESRFGRSNASSQPHSRHRATEVPELHPVGENQQPSYTPKTEPPRHQYHEEYPPRKIEYRTPALHEYPPASREPERVYQPLQDRKVYTPAYEERGGHTYKREGEDHRLEGFRESSGHSVNAKQLSDMAKLYPDEMKYTGALYDVLDSKLLILKNVCEKLEIPMGGFPKFFSLMLKGEALDFYYNVLCQEHTVKTYDTLVNKIKGKFETEQKNKVYISDWRRTRFSTIVASNLGKTKMECLDLLHTKLVKAQRASSTIGKDDETLCQQLIYACEESPEFRNALFRPENTTSELLDQLQRDLYLEQLEEPRQFMRERRYEGGGRETRFGGNRAGTTKGNTPTDKKCFVCKKEGCYSTRHTPEERKRSAEEYRAGKHSMPEKTWRSFTTWYEGTDPEEQEEVSQAAFEELLSQFYQDCPSERDEESPEMRQGSAHMSFGASSFRVDGELITENLTNAAARHLLTREDPYEDQEHTLKETSYLLEGRYSSAAFKGIMPNTGASHISTAGQEKVRALQRLDPSITINWSGPTAKIKFGDGDRITTQGTVTVPTDQRG